MERQILTEASFIKPRGQKAVHSVQKWLRQHTEHIRGSSFAAMEHGWTHWESKGKPEEPFNPLGLIVSCPKHKAEPQPNVTRIPRVLRRTCHDGTHQIIMYDSGVGSSDSYVEKFTGGLLGT